MPRLILSTGPGNDPGRIVDLATGEVLRRTDLEPQLFGEGIAPYKGLLVMLTWKAGTAIYYSRNRLTEQYRKTYTGEGWGLTTDGEVSCWSESAEWLAMMGTPPTGPFVELSVDFPTCALRPTGEAVCWGQRWLTGPTPGPLAAFQPADERYAHMTTGGGFFCGILLDGRLSCWGENGYGQTSPPMPE